MGEPFELFVACAPGIEPFLAAEIEDTLEVTPDVVRGGVELEGDPTLVMRLNLELGLATHVLLRVADFRARSLGELTRKTARADWGSVLAPDVPIEIRATARRSRLYHTGAIAERVWKGIADRLGREPSKGTGGVAVAVRMERDRCTLSLDTSGEPLHRRGYRLRGGPAPLREDLARATLAVAGWTGAWPLADPMAGTGTIPIEAALKARQIAPGLHRRFAFERTPIFDSVAWERVRAVAVERALSTVPAPIFASDRDADAVRAIEENAERAGVRPDLQVDRAPLGRAPFRDAALHDSGALITDPPHGRRMGDPDALRELYRKIGEVARTVPTPWVALTCSDRRLALASGLPLKTGLLTDAGGTKLRVLVTHDPPELT